MEGRGGEEWAIAGGIRFIGRRWTVVGEVEGICIHTHTHTHTHILTHVYTGEGGIDRTAVKFRWRKSRRKGKRREHRRRRRRRRKKRRRSKRKRS